MIKNDMKKKYFLAFNLTYLVVIIFVFLMVFGNGYIETGNFDVDHLKVYLKVVVLWYIGFAVIVLGVIGIVKLFGDEI